MKTKPNLTKDERFQLFNKRMNIFLYVLIVLGVIQGLYNAIKYIIDRLSGLDYQIDLVSAMSLLICALVLAVALELVSLEYRLSRLEAKEKEPDKSDS